ncbi:MAG: alpha/beta fold hydrolase [Burkholderiaceae bacterium]|nr:alpha/beta fold hydrolase [Burkholderiaceae bacterium]
MTPEPLPPLDPALLPPGVRSRFVAGVNGLRMHLLEAGHESTGRPVVLLLHGFPELAYSWRKLMPALAAAGYHAIAPDQRGYGRTTGWDDRYDGDVASYRLLNLVRDALGLVMALGHRVVAAVVGHDFGAPVAAWCALLRPDVFRSVVLMSAPFGGPPPLPFDTAKRPAAPPGPSVHDALAALPRPRKHYQWHYATREANDDLWRCPQGVHDVLRAYYHHKSADWPGNRPEPLRGWTAAELARMPTYYVMDLHQGMAATVAAEMPTPAQIAACRWLPDAELRVYSAEYRRTGFQGGLNWYRCSIGEAHQAELQIFAGRRIEVPALYLAGRADWGTFQRPGAFEAMQSRVCPQLRGCHLIDGAGHWVQQEQPEAVNRLLLDFLQPR